MIVFLFLNIIYYGYCGRQFVCATANVNVRNEPCGDEVTGLITSGTRKIRVQTSSTQCWGHDWIKFDDGGWSAATYFEECNMKVCATTNVNIRNHHSTSSGDILLTAQTGQKFRWTGDMVQFGDYLWFRFEFGEKWAASEYFNPCDDDDEEGEVIVIPLSQNQLKSCMPGLSDNQAQSYLPGLNNALAAGEINSCRRVTCFLAQVGHESGSLQWWEEFASGVAYNNRDDLCNGPTDGPKYKGRGPIQLTGRCNYRAASISIYGSTTLEGNPYQVSTNPQVGFQTTRWYWDTRNLNNYCDSGTQSGFDQVTYRINGGYNGKADRDQRWQDCREALGC